MQARRLLRIVSLALGLLMADTSSAVSVRVVPVPHTGMSQDELESAYVESYEQSGFSLLTRVNEPLPEGGWVITLVFRWQGETKSDEVLGTTLIITESQSKGCEPCELVRQTFRPPDSHSSDPVLRERGYRTLLKADTEALAKVRARLGVSLPEMPPPVYGRP